MDHNITPMKGSWNDTWFKRGGDYLIKTYTCPKCGKVIKVKSHTTTPFIYTCDGKTQTREAMK